jgi:NAD(P)-dependent dehydrogenase (short-subunit alcohol dehydrogenase family)
MAASLAVEWANKGIRVNALRCEWRVLWQPARLISSSPGYMLTKLTKTVLEIDSDLKVAQLT